MNIIDIEESTMTTSPVDVDQRIAQFLNRKDQKYPELGLVGSHRQLRTFKHSIMPA